MQKQFLFGYLKSMQTTPITRWCLSWWASCCLFDAVLTERVFLFISNCPATLIKKSIKITLDTVIGVARKQLRGFGILGVGLHWFWEYFCAFLGLYNRKGFIWGPWGSLTQIYIPNITPIDSLPLFETSAYYTEKICEVDCRPIASCKSCDPQTLEISTLPENESQENQRNNRSKKSSTANFIRDEWCAADRMPERWLTVWSSESPLCHLGRSGVELVITQVDRDGLEKGLSIMFTKRTDNRVEQTHWHTGWYSRH